MAAPALPGGVFDHAVDTQFDGPADEDRSPAVLVGAGREQVILLEPDVSACDGNFGERGPTFVEADDVGIIGNRDRRPVFPHSWSIARLEPGFELEVEEGAGVAFPPRDRRRRTGSRCERRAVSFEHRSPSERGVSDGNDGTSREEPAREGEQFVNRVVNERGPASEIRNDARTTLSGEDVRYNPASRMFATSVNSVRVKPGDTASASTPYSRHSFHSASPTIRLKALVAP